MHVTGEYVGQTKAKVKGQLDKAKGGVLFIEEAYELGKGVYGNEACTTLVAAMTDPKYDGLAIILAGYHADMLKMLDTNEGLKSRVQHFIEFPDWKAADCVHFFSKKAQNGHFELDIPSIEGILKKGLSLSLSLLSLYFPTYIFSRFTLSLNLSLSLLSLYFSLSLLSPSLLSLATFLRPLSLYFLFRLSHSLSLSTSSP